jgi:hypothetical protein
MPTDFVFLAPVWIDPLVSYKAVKGFHQATSKIPSRVYLIDCAIGSNDGAVGTYGDPTDYAVAVASACVARKTAGSNYAVITPLLPRADGVRAEPNLPGD